MVASEGPKCGPIEAAFLDFCKSVVLDGLSDASIEDLRKAFYGGVMIGHKRSTSGIHARDTINELLAYMTAVELHGDPYIRPRQDL